MRLIDADAYQFPGDLINEPTIDAVEVVRCKDCIYQHRPQCCPFQAGGFSVCRDWYCPLGIHVKEAAKALEELKAKAGE